MRLPTGRAPARPAAVLPSLALAMVLAAGGLAGCGEHARLPFMAGVGPDPVLPPPVRTAIPTVDIAPAVGWPPGASPTPAAGLSVTPLATGLDHPRWLHVLPNGDVLVAETNAPPRERRDRGLEARVMGLLMARAGAGTPSADRITLLRDADGDGRAELRSVFLDGLASPFGMALVGDTLYIANTDALVRVPYRTGQLRAEAAPELVVSLPAGPRNHHWTKNVIAAPDGARLYVTVGSNSNVAEHGMEEEVDRAAILEVDPVAGTRTPFATGLRNPNGMAWRGGVLWTVVNERDALGSDLVPDYLTSVRRDGFYGWPYSYFGDHVDTRVRPARPDLVARALVPDYALGTHVAALGLAFTGADHPAPRDLPARFGDGAFVGLHGSWNRRPPAGYAVVFVPFAGDGPSGLPVEVLGGFLDAEGNARGRPVGVAIDGRGGLLVADDVGNTVWRVSGGTAP